MRKHLHGLLFVATTVCACISLNAQETRKFNHSVQIRVLSADYALANPDLNAKSYLFVPNGVEFGYTSTINDKLSFSIPLKYHRANISESQSSLSIYSTDALAKYNFYREEAKIIPYVFAGGGLVYEEVEGVNVQLPAGLGLNYKMASHSMITLESQYRYSLAENRNNLQIALGVSFTVGKITELDPEKELDPLKVSAEDVVKDEEMDIETMELEEEYTPDEARPMEDEETEMAAKSIVQDMEAPSSSDKINDRDGDGVKDADDDCPELAGSALLYGCPDLDKDGIADKYDNCPDKAGPVDRGGCPLQDRDGDGVEDSSDACPDAKGLASMAGCPDTDGDGVKDSDDLCPSVAGTINGCPDKDSDNDGVMDSKDKCPNTFGDAAHMGCPEMEEEEKNMLVLAAESVQFQFGKAHLKAVSYQILDQISDLLKKYPEFELEIIGHTDDVGRKASNLELSTDRANSCRDYLISRGIGQERILVKAEGELKPIQSNATEEGREQNRRVEFKVIGQ